MGIEYTHYLVGSPDRVGTVADARRIDEILREVGLTCTGPRLERLRGDVATPIARSFADLTRDEPNLRLVYDGIREGPVLARLMGLSQWGAADEERYLMGITVTVGRDLRVQRSDDSFFFDVTAPPRRNGLAVRTYASSKVYPADAHTAPPDIAILVEHEEEAARLAPGFPGVWRVGVELDCGKDFPAFARATYRMPGRALADALEALLGPIFEIGSVRG